VEPGFCFDNEDTERSQECDKVNTEPGARNIIRWIIAAGGSLFE
jgi:hypothetical protein